MRFTTYILLTILAFGGMGWLRSQVESPERLILGVWYEQAWEYEKVGTPADLSYKDTVSESVKNQLGKHLVIHSAETWHFEKNGVLWLIGHGQAKQARWRLKGRGHILELEHRNHVIEHYNLTEITPDRLVLNFDSDIQVRGIAKLTFKRSRLAKKIQQ
ncbi:MAG TPA: hypothetical protein VK177_11375 [Flavobacteriales bacterium]|nr:hypothetical protein [Flavobacteriales bacterium]